jgi:NADH-quinone oxidoreductase subunit A
MTAQAITIGIFVALGIVFWMIALGAALLVRPSRPSAVKGEPYECGTESVGSAWYQVHVRYYIFALLFVLFDVEVAYLYPWATIFRRIEGFQVQLFGEVAVFVLLLVFGLVYAWRKGMLEWE